MLSRWPIYDRVLVNLIDGSALAGILIRRSGPMLMLSDTTLYSPGGEPAHLDGTVYVERDQVLYLQATPQKVLPGPAT